MKVTFDFVEQKIVIDGDGDELVEVLKGARELAPKLTHISIETTQRNAEPVVRESSAASNSGNGQGLKSTTLKQFLKPLHLSATPDRIAAVAYYFKHHEQRETFSPKDMDTWFTHGGLQKPAQMSVAFFDCRKRNGYIDSAGHAKWKLTTQGENLIIGKLNEDEDE